MSNKQAGFTLVELIVALTVVGIIVVGITNLFITVEGTQRRTAHLETASRAGEQKLESLRNVHYNNLTTGSTITFTSELPASIPTPRTATVAITEPTTGLKRLDLTITYREGKKDKTVLISSEIGVIGIGQ
jgi:prepilin-type N-terminal cleavage/methylation domain-containing protein